jgi:hypothetical protein
MTYVGDTISHTAVMLCCAVPAAWWCGWSQRSRRKHCHRYAGFWVSRLLKGVPIAVLHSHTNRWLCDTHVPRWPVCAVWCDAMPGSLLCITASLLLTNALCTYRAFLADTTHQNCTSKRTQTHTLTCRIWIEDHPDFADRNYWPNAKNGFDGQSYESLSSNQWSGICQPPEDGSVPVLCK